MPRWEKYRTISRTDVKRLRQLLVATVSGYFGRLPRTCPLCGYEGYFHSFGQPQRIDARCPTCDSLERHRLLALVADQRDLFAGKDVLHFAPEPSIERLVTDQRPTRHDRSDFGDPTTLNLDVEHTGLAEASYDVVILSHVLEHVDDRQALVEMHRILRPGGTLVVMVPIVEGWDTTYEDPTITSHRDRTSHFGQWDHVRFYGRDLRDRITDAGFRLDEITAGPDDVHRYGLMRGEKVFLCSR